MELWSQILLPFLINSWWLGLSSFHESVLHPIHVHQNKNLYVWEERVAMPGHYYQINRYNRQGTLLQSFSLDSLNHRTSLSYYDSKGRVWRLDSLFYQDSLLTGFKAYSVSTGEIMLNASIEKDDSTIFYRWADGENEYLGAIQEDSLGNTLELFDAQNLPIWMRIDSTTSSSLDTKTNDKTINYLLKNGHQLSYTVDTLGFMQSIKESDALGAEIFSSRFRYEKGRVIEKRHIFPHIYLDIVQPGIERKALWKKLLKSDEVVVKSLLAKHFSTQAFFTNVHMSTKDLTVKDQYLPDGKTLFRRRYFKQNHILYKEVFYKFSANGRDEISYYYDDKSRIIQIYAPNSRDKAKYYRTFYDDQNNIVRQERLDSKKHVLEATHYSYDSFSKLAFIEDVNMLGQPVEIQEVYGVPHSKILRKRKANGQLIADYYLDSHQDIIKTVFYDYIDDMIFAEYYSDERGLFKQRRYSLDGAIDHRLYLNSEGQIIKEQFYSPQKDLLKERLFNIKKSLIQEVAYDPYGNFIYKSMTKLNENGNPISKKVIDRTEELTEVQSFSYGENGIVLRQLFSGDGTVIYTISTEYDTLGRKQFETWMDAEKLMYRKVIFQYDIEGHLEREIYMSPYTSKPEVYEYKYSNTGLLLLKEHYENDSLKEEIYYHYYPKQKMRMLVYKLADGTITRKEIENL